MAIRRIIINESAVDSITTLLNNIPHSASFHSTSSCDEPGMVYYDYNMTNPYDDLPSISKDISGTATYCRDHSWTSPPGPEPPTYNSPPSPWPGSL
jgi:hypothetical protein